MAVIIAFLTILAGIAAWWLSHQRLAAKPWLEVGTIGTLPDVEAPAWPAAKIGLCVFLAVVGSLFAILISAYSLRVRAVDWTTYLDTRLLWLNTLVLVLSSVAMQWAVTAAQRGDRESVVRGLGIGCLCTLLFLSGQLVVWHRLAEGGFYASSHPASAFFYLITGIHGLHLAGGILALARVAANVSSASPNVRRARLGVELCAIYWHFLLGIWLVVFAILVLGPWAAWLYATCVGG